MAKKFTNAQLDRADYAYRRNLPFTLSDEQIDAIRNADKGGFMTVQLIIEVEEKHIALLERFAELTGVPLASLATIFMTHQLIHEAQKKGWIEKPTPAALIARQRIGLRP